MNIRLLVGGGAALSLTCAAIMFGGRLVGFMGLPSFLLVIGLAVGATIWSCRMADIALAVGLALRSTDIDDAKRGQAVFHRAADASVAACMIGTVIGLAQMLSNLSDPTAVGPAMSMALLTLLYGVFLGEVCLRSMAADLNGRSQASLPGPGRRRGSVSIYLPLLCLFIVASAYMVLNTGDGVPYPLNSRRPAPKTSLVAIEKTISTFQANQAALSPTAHLGAALLERTRS